MIGTANSSPLYFPMGDQAIVVQFKNEISIEVSKQVQMFAHLIQANKIPGIIQLLPAFNNLTVCYDPKVVGFIQLKAFLEGLEDFKSTQMDQESKTISLPVVFGNEYGADLDIVAKKADLTTDEVIQLLLSKSYFVYMLGFIAGYPYCGDIDKRLSLPRRSNPRIKVPKGTIQIVNNLCGIFTMTAPSGWHLMGWTPMDIFNPNIDPPCLLQAGDYVKYVPIKASEAENWDEKRQRKWDQEWNSLQL
ncbi:5-oxoprolinase subunit PxpB [Neobacillus sp. NPDC097160]|uniref:5-oxoprolinase subunit PxpB n=1 Tax=Neobacillus sp. NPDC097160 TaxID=3364298 RepID=UPI0037FCD034